MLDSTVVQETPSSSTPSKEGVLADSFTVLDPFDVFWDDELDPSNPMNWSSKFRWGHIVLISLLTFVTSLGSSMLAPAVPQLMTSLGSNDAALKSFVVSVYVIGTAVGPLVIAPLSELYGRAIIYNVSNVLFLGCTIGCALSTNVGMFIAFRFLTGCVGVTPLALGGGSIGDVMQPEAMGTAMAIWGLGSLVAPVFAPVAGGYLSQAAGWRWIFWVIAILMGVVTLLSPLLLRETYAPVLLEQKAKRLRKQTGNPNFKSRLDLQIPRRGMIVSALVRPVKFLFTSPIVAVLAVDVAVIYGYQYLVFTSLSYIFQDQYHLSTGLSGVTYLGDGIGTILGVVIVGTATDKVANRKKKANKELQPEDWLWPMVPAGFLIPIGLFWYGWSVEAYIFPVVPLVGLGIFGFATMGIVQPVQIYLVNAFPVHSASALAASSLLRRIVGALLPLSGLKMYKTLGMGWGNSLLAFIALALTPISFLMMHYGGRLRIKDRNVK